MTNCTISRNVADQGGGVHCNNDGTLKLLNRSSITECIGYKGGGGIYNAKGTLNVKGAPQVTQNAAAIGRNSLWSLPVKRAWSSL